MSITDSWLKRTDRAASVDKTLFVIVLNMCYINRYKGSKEWKYEFKIKSRSSLISWWCFIWTDCYQEKCRTFCNVLLSGTLSSGLLSGIMSALLSALRQRLGLLCLTASSPAWVMFLQKSTFISSRLTPWATTPSRPRSVMRTQFSRWRKRSFLQLHSTEITSWSVMCPQPDRARERRLGHLRHKQQSETNDRLAHTWWICWESSFHITRVSTYIIVARD